jgi:hypothetical protein
MAAPPPYSRNSALPLVTRSPTCGTNSIRQPARRARSARPATSNASTTPVRLVVTVRESLRSASGSPGRRVLRSGDEARIGGLDDFLATVADSGKDSDRPQGFAYLVDHVEEDADPRNAAVHGHPQRPQTRSEKR